MTWGDHVDGPAPVGVPVRFRTTPLLALVALGLLPVALLGALLVWSDREADAHEAAEQSIPQAPPVVTGVAPTLTTSMLSVRRAPSSIATVASDNLFNTAMAQLGVFIDERSCVSVAVDDRPVFTSNGDTPVIPASTNKLIVAGVAIEVLGPDHVFATSVAAAAPVEGVLDGDLYLIGGGDPLLVAPGVVDDDPAAAEAVTSLDALADAVVDAGITTIRGSVVGDATRYDDVVVNPAWGDGVGFVDAGPIGGLVVNDGRVVGRSSRQNDPGEAAAREFARLLQDRGVSVFNGWESGVADATVPVIASTDSAPLEVIVADMLTRSDNDTAEMLVKEIGVVVGNGGTTAAGLAVIESVLASWEAPVGGVELVDGSGLAATNRLTCDTLIGVLQHLGGTDVVTGIPVAGRTGTLAFDFVGSPVEGRLVGKTGTLTNPPGDEDPPEVKALAGYLPVGNGETIAFSIVLNGAGYVTTDGYVPFWDALAERLDAYPEGPGPEAFGPR